MKLPQIKGLDKVRKGIVKAGHVGKKHSPLILTVTGGVGIVATAYFAYKSHGQVKEIVDRMEEDRNSEERMNDLNSEINQLTEDANRFRANGYYDAEASTQERIAEAQEDLSALAEEVTPFDRMAYTKELVAAVALPVATGVASISCIALSYYIMNNRVMALTGALASATAEQVLYRKRVKDEYGEEVDNRFAAPVENTGDTVVNDDGEEEEVFSVIEAENALTGAWFSDSGEYAADDHSYNEAYVNSAMERLNIQFAKNGSLLLNHVYDALGMPRTRTGGLMGWSGAGFAMDYTVFRTPDPATGQIEQQIHVQWTRPNYVYDTAYIGSVENVGAI